MKERHSEARTTAMKAAMNPFAKGAGAIDRNLNGDVQMTWVLAFLKSGFVFDLLWVEREVGTCGRAPPGGDADINARLFPVTVQNSPCLPYPSLPLSTHLLSAPLIETRCGEVVRLSIH